MRNWNFLVAPLIQPTFRFQTTYEELKQYIQAGPDEENYRFQTTYEELKRLKIKYLIPAKGFQTTYEELKRQYDSVAWTYTDSFQTTYEELKLWNCRVLCAGYILSFQTTYEELKRVHRTTTTAETRRFQTTYEELKLRGSETIPLFPISLPDYLWGIETGRPRGYGPEYMLPDYLWGIETRNTHSRYPSLRESFQTTYEELKPWRRCRGWGRFLASRLPMRNWN